MDRAELTRLSQQDPRPLVVEFWAPWCAPCRSMVPALERASEEYASHVRLLKLNADENAGLLRELNVMAIPTILTMEGGQITHRYTGAMSGDRLHNLFDNLANPGSAAHPAAGIDPVTRGLRLGAGAVLIVVGIVLNHWLVAAAGGLAAFWGWYDRCPVWQAFAPRIRRWFTRDSA